MILYNINYVCTADTRVDGKQLWWNNESIISTTCQSLTGFISVGSFKLGLVSFQKVLGQVSLWLCRLHWQLRWYLKLAWLIMISIENIDICLRTSSGEIVKNLRATLDFPRAVWLDNKSFIDSNNQLSAQLRYCVLNNGIPWVDGYD